MQEEVIGEPGTARGAQPAAELARALSEALSAADHARVRSLVEGLEAPDLADLIEQLEPAQRVPLIEVPMPIQQHHRQRKMHRCATCSNGMPSV